ncbi:MAG: threonine/serine exporter family protein [Clostridia bacterium]|nr:threonine/serine exporter family protein [Clostridia bacterium]
MNITNEELMGIIIRLITSITGTIGFSLMFKVPRKRLFWAALGGLTTSAVYELTAVLGGDPMLSAFMSSLFMALYSEFFARILHAPAVIFLFPCAIPIVPGRGLYYTIYYTLFYNQEKLLFYAKPTLSIALGIAVGVSFASIIVSVLMHISKRFHEKKQCE